jgi:hypothetical protein
MSFEDIGYMTVAHILVMINLRRVYFRILLSIRQQGLSYKHFTMKEYPSDVIDTMFMAMG